MMTVWCNTQPAIDRVLPRRYNEVTRMWSFFCGFAAPQDLRVPDDNMFTTETCVRIFDYYKHEVNQERFKGIVDKIHLQNSRFEAVEFFAWCAPAFAWMDYKCDGKGDEKTKKRNGRFYRHIPVRDSADWRDDDHFFYRNDRLEYWATSNDDISISLQGGNDNMTYYLTGIREHVASRTEQWELCEFDCVEWAGFLKSLTSRLVYFWRIMEFESWHQSPDSTPMWRPSSALIDEHYHECLSCGIGEFGLFVDQEYFDKRKGHERPSLSSTLLSELHDVHPSSMSERLFLTFRLLQPGREFKVAKACVFNSNKVVEDTCNSPGSAQGISICEVSPIPQCDASYHRSIEAQKSV